MQNPGLNVEEVVYEITASCNHNCEYCGSKDKREPLGDLHTLSDNVDKIVKSILTVKPKTLVITGGNPVLVPKEIHRKIREQCNAAHTNLSIVISAKDLAEDVWDSTLEVLSNYGTVGISINDEEDLNLFKKFRLMKYIDGMSMPWHPVIITNVNNNNVFSLDDIADVISEHEFCWQLQLTMYKSNNSSAKLRGESLEYFAEKLKKYKERGIQMFYGDNLVESRPCSAGITTCAVRANGDLIGCLSSYMWEGVSITNGNLLTSPLTLESLWSISFNRERFSQHFCCKDFCGNVDINSIMTGKSPDRKPSVRRPRREPEQLPLQEREPIDDETIRDLAAEMLRAQRALGFPPLIPADYYGRMVGTYAVITPPFDLGGTGGIGSAGGTPRTTTNSIPNDSATIDTHTGYAHSYSLLGRSYTGATEYDESLLGNSGPQETAQ